MHTAMIQLRLLYGLKKDVEKAEPKRVHEKIPKLMRFELSANIFQGRDMQPADSNGLADPYVKVICCGVERETAVIERTLQPIWYQRLSIPLDLPRDLTLAPKVPLARTRTRIPTPTLTLTLTLTLTRIPTPTPTPVPHPDPNPNPNPSP